LIYYLQLQFLVVYFLRFEELYIQYNSAHFFFTGSIAFKMPSCLYR